MVNDPNQQSEMAKETFRLFEENGVNLSDERHTIHYFYDGDFEGLAAALSKLGYTVRPTANNDGVIAEAIEVTNEEWRINTLRALSELANEYGVEYDGWEAAMTKQGGK
ncbi:MAG: ribonuclease E inhibitor RraB [Pseudomonadota bacterium]